MRPLILTLFCIALASGDTSFPAVWKKQARRDVSGVLTISGEGIAFEPNGDKQKSKSWAYFEIQHVDRISTTQLSIRGYEGSFWRMGAELTYRFRLLEGSLGDDLYAQIADRTEKPATDRATSEPPPDATLQIPAKHLRRFRGSEGTLYVTPDRILYLSDTPKASRAWLLERDVATIWSSGQYRLEVHAFDGTEGPAHAPRVYRFALKRPLDPAVYRNLKLRLHQVSRARAGLSADAASSSLDNRWP